MAFSCAEDGLGPCGLWKEHGKPLNSFGLENSNRNLLLFCFATEKKEMARRWCLLNISVPFLVPQNVLISKKRGKKEMWKVKKKKKKISQKHNNLINMHLKCVCLCIYVRGLCVSCWKDVFRLWSSLLCAPCESGVAKKGAPHPHYQALCTVSLIKRLLYLGPATLNYTRCTLAGKTSPHAAENY